MYLILGSLKDLSCYEIDVKYLNILVGFEFNYIKRTGILDNLCAKSLVTMKSTAPSYANGYLLIKQIL
jgi:hypothetical protein